MKIDDRLLLAIASPEVLHCIAYIEVEVLHDVDAFDAKLIVMFRMIHGFHRVRRL